MVHAPSVPSSSGLTYFQPGQVYRPSSQHVRSTDEVDASYPLAASPSSGNSPTADQSDSSVSPTNHKTTLNVVVPAGAVVYLDDYLTKSTGKKRRYVWNHLQPDQIVPCRIRVEITVNGKKVQKSRQLNLRGGLEGSLAFDFERIETKLTVIVPPKAKVYLAKSLKSGSGPVRTFTSTKLAPGEGVTDYPVRVSVLRDGQEITKVQRISLDSGQSKTLAFHFDRETTTSSFR